MWRKTNFELYDLLQSACSTHLVYAQLVLLTTNRDHFYKIWYKKLVLPKILLCLIMTPSEKDLLQVTFSLKIFHLFHCNSTFCDSTSTTTLNSLNSSFDKYFSLKMQWHFVHYHQPSKSTQNFLRSVFRKSTF